jgi:hypothetical protein
MLVLETNKEIKGGERGTFWNEILQSKWINYSIQLCITWIVSTIYIFYIMDFGKFVNPLH